MRTFVRRLLVGVGTILAILALVASGLHVAAGRKLARTYDIAPLALAEPAADSAMVARGAHLAGPIGKCADCHGDDLGGQIMVDDPALGRLAAPNITSGGVTAAYTLADWNRAVRHGVARDGRGLLVMPATDYAPMSDADLVALVTYLRQVPAVERAQPTSRLRVVGRALYVGNKLPLVSAERIDHAAPRTAPPAGATVEYGRYLANIGACTGCHNPELTGGPHAGSPPGTPPPSNLTPGGIGHYTEADFFRALRDGVRPDGSALHPSMPVRFTKGMTDEETRAIWLYLRSLPSRPYASH